MARTGNTTTRVITALAALALCSGCASRPFRGWDEGDRWTFGIFATCQVADAWQTAQIREEPDLVEANPLYGKEPEVQTILAIKSISTALAYYAADAAPRYRTAALGGATAICAAVVAHNASLLDR